MQNDSLSEAGKPVYGIYFWWCGIIAMTQVLQLYFKYLYALSASSGDSSRSVFLYHIADGLQISLPVIAAGTVFFVLVVYRTSKFRRTPFGRGAADVWCLCIALPLAYGNLISMIMPFTGAGAGAGSPSSSVGSTIVQTSLALNSGVLLLLLSAALLATGEILEMKRFRAAGCLLAAGSVALALLYLQSLMGIQKSGGNLFSLPYAGPVTETACLLWVGFTLRSNRPGKSPADKPGRAIPAVYAAGRIVPPGKGEKENSGGSMESWKNPVPREKNGGSGHPQKKQR